MEITEKWLGSIGGWQVLQSARRIVSAQAVSEIVRDETGVRGVVSEGPRRYQSGLLIKGRSDVENLCTCPTSRGRGLICSHSIAVALSSVSKPPPPRPERRFTSSDAPRPANPAPAPRPVEPPPGKFTVFLPQNVLSGYIQGQAACFLKFEPGQGTAPDGSLALWLKEQGVRPGSMPLMLTRRDLMGFFTALGEHRSVYEGKPSSTLSAESLVSIAREPIRLPAVIDEQSDGSILISLESKGASLVLEAPDRLWIYEPAGRSLFPVLFVGEEMKTLATELLSGAVHRSLEWLVRHRDELETTLIPRLLGPTLASLHLEPLPIRLVLGLDGSLQAIEARVEVVYDKHRWQVMAESTGSLTFPVQDAEKKQRFYTRNLARENAAVEALLNAGFEIATATTMRLSGAEKVTRFYASELPRLTKWFELDESPRWKGATKGLLRVTPKAVEPRHAEPAPRTGHDWLALEIAYTAPDGFRISRSDVLQMIRTGRSSMTGKDGKRYVIDESAIEEFEDTLRDTDSELTPNGINVRADKAQYLLGMSDESWAEKQRAEWMPEEQLLNAIPDLAKTLRAYQIEGVRALDAAMRGPRAALLADDMGLGKTLQTLAVLRLLKQKPDTQQPALIVCPKSLVPNWLAEFEKFAPSLKVTPVQGSDRAAQIKTALTTSDAIITSYPLLARDKALYKGCTFSLMALDEASFIRNPDTDAAKAARAIQADCRIALTGTPIENSARDLWSIFHFLLPGYLGSRDTFRDRFEKPLSSGPGSPDGTKAATRLRKLIRPFYLRRTKREVLRDLPEKLEQILWCDLTGPQMEVYKRLMEEGHAEVKDARKRTGQTGARMTMFTVLLRLRQACCDLRLTNLPQEVISGLPPDDLSGKLSLWKERVAEITAAGGKVLVFSQFVKFLQLFKQTLEAEGQPFCYLDGQSQDRAAQVERFQKDPTARVFLISLKAGGYGLNLTAADHVMLMDPWWNPAVEAQAIDRAHRLGQERVVTAIRFVARGTVEEKIIKLQNLKRGIIESTLDEDTPLMGALTTEDLEQVLGE
ncbi:MAG: DEAD/DEAH box helicase family protein [Verrucomicrobiaceae bacterium]|nr:DEAD/DEAH box helicase family protein [Verrucomicrobiaceae bacterium]